MAFIGKPDDTSVSREANRYQGMKIELKELGSITHESAEPSHYDESAASYDVFNEEKSKTINECIENILRQSRVKHVLDMSCGTGSQVFWLTRSGYDVIGADFNRKMLEIARQKSVKENLAIKFIEADMRDVQLDGPVDAVISIFNAIGHLTKEDFKRTIQNVLKLVNEDGLFIFDIFNLNYLLHEDRITKLTIDWLKDTENGQKRVLQFSTIDNEGILSSCTTVYGLRNSKTVEVKTSQQTLQVYSAAQLVELLDRHGFDVIGQTDIDGSIFSDIDTERVLTVARKQRKTT